MSSTRLPGKVLKKAVDWPLLALMVERLQRVPSLDGVVIATTVNPADAPIVELAETLGVGWHRGSEEDITDRLLGTAAAHGIDVIVQTTGDCPLIDPEVVERCVADYRQGGADHVSNILTRSYPIGMDTQVFATDVLADVARRTDDPFDREHGSVFIYKHPELYGIRNVAAPAAFTDPTLRLTVDTVDDYRFVDGIFEALYPNDPGFGLADIFHLLRQQPAMRAINEHVEHRYV